MNRFSLVLACVIFPFAWAAMAPAWDDAPTRRVYVSLGGENKLVWLTLDDQGKLKKAGELATGAGPGAMALLEKQRLLYLGTRGDKSANLYRLGDSGTPEFVASAPLIGGPVYLAVDPSRKFLFAAYYGEGKVSCHALGENGVPGKEPVQVLETLKNPHSVQVNGGRVYVPNTGSDVIFARDWDGSKGLISSSQELDVKAVAGSGPRHFAFHPLLPIVYFVNEKDSTVGVYKKSARRGGLYHSQTISTLPANYSGKNTCADIHVSPNGKFVYASNRGHNSLAVFKVDDGSGKLSQVEVTETEKIPRAFQIDPSGEFLVCAGQESGGLSVYRIDKTTGKISQTDAMKLGKSPSWVEITLGK